MSERKPEKGPRSSTHDFTAAEIERRLRIVKKKLSVFKQKGEIPRYFEAFAICEGMVAALNSETRKETEKMFSDVGLRAPTFPEDLPFSDQSFYQGLDQSTLCNVRSLLRDGPSLSKRDLSLIAAWANISTSEISENANLDSLRDCLGDFELSRLYSARVAELSAKAYLEAFYGFCEDESIKQINDVSSDWQICDLRVGDTAYDVKNTRRNYESKNRFSELCVPRFKSYRDTMQESKNVKILGTLSQYQTASKIEHGSSNDILVLGETSQNEIKILQETSNRIFGKIIDFSGLRDFQTSTMMLPGWLFNYPDKLYENQLGIYGNSYLQFVSEKNSSDLEFKFAPVALRLALLDSSSVAFDELQKHSLPKLLLEFTSQAGRNIGALVCFIIGITLSNLDKKPILILERLRQWIFLSDRCMPIGVYDPLSYVSEFIEAFDEMLKKVASELKRFKMFRLRGPYIIQGKKDGGDWKTIYAYCGGWRKTASGPRIRCGTNPIYLGNSDSCEECGRLICPNCLFCNSSCDLCAERQSDY